jgi:hypothetical protein
MKLLENLSICLFYVLLMIPFLLLWIWVFKKGQFKIVSALDFCKMALLTEFFLFFYDLMLLIVGLNIPKEKGDYLVAACYGAYFFILFAFLLTLALLCLALLIRAIERYQKR